MVLWPGPAIMPVMDHTRIDDLLSELETADPAEAPDKANEIATLLSTDLETESSEGNPPEAPA